MLNTYDQGLILIAEGPPSGEDLLTDQRLKSTTKETQNRPHVSSGHGFYPDKHIKAAKAEISTLVRIVDSQPSSINVLII